MRGAGYFRGDSNPSQGETREFEILAVNSEGFQSDAALELA